MEEVEKAVDLRVDDGLADERESAVPHVLSLFEPLRDAVLLFL